LMQDRNRQLDETSCNARPDHTSGYNPAVVANDFVFVAGNTGAANDPRVFVPPTRNWGGETAFRRQVHYVIKERLEPSLKAAGSALEHSLKAQAFIRGTDNFPDFMDAWSQHFHDIPCALTVTPAKDYATTDAMLEVNLIALKNGATRRKQVIETGVPPLATFGPCVRAGELVFPSGFIAVGRDGLVPGATNFGAFDCLSLAGQVQGAALFSHAEMVCKAAGVSMANVVRAQYFLPDIRDFAGVATAWSDRYGRQPHPFSAVQVPGPMLATNASVIGDFWIYAA
jgi:enamine deaminase RidA (YjgF/YER057c/UK114 family)